MIQFIQWIFSFFRNIFVQNLVYDFKFTLLAFIHNAFNILLFTKLHSYFIENVFYNWISCLIKYDVFVIDCKLYFMRVML